MTTEVRSAGEAAPAERVATFAAFLAGRGLRLTPERDRIVRLVASWAQHFGPDELVASLGRGARISRATVYRTLDLLLEAGIIRRIELGPLGVRYEHDLGRDHHDHLACLGCGLLIEFASPEIERLQDEVCLEHDFIAIRHLHRVMGLCRECRAAGRGVAPRRRGGRSGD